MLPEPVEFMWDKGNIDKNRIKHSVTIQEAEEMFASEPFASREDLKHGSRNEKRYQALGRTKTNRKLFVAFTIKEQNIRVIRNRDMTANEEVAYERLKAVS